MGAGGVPGRVRVEGLPARDRAGAADRARLRVDGHRDAALRRRLRVPEPRARRRHRVPGRDERVRASGSCSGSPWRDGCSRPWASRRSSWGWACNCENQSLIDAAVWCQTSAGVVTSSASSAPRPWPLLLVTGFKNYVRLQYFMFARHRHPDGASCWCSSCAPHPAQFATAMNNFAFAVDGREGYYQWIQKDVADAGVNLAAASSPSAPPAGDRRSSGPACSGPPTACSRAARSRAPACSRTRCSSSSAR